MKLAFSNLKLLLTMCIYPDIKCNYELNEILNLNIPHADMSFNIFITTDVGIDW